MKKRILVTVLMAIGIISAVRIAYVNAAQNIVAVNSYDVGEEFEYKGFLMSVSDVRIYDAEEFMDAYEDVPEELLTAANEAVIELNVTNISAGDNVFYLNALALQTGYESGGNLNPYIYQLLNPGMSGSPSLEKGESLSILITFPLGNETLESGDDIKLILALYPEKYEVRVL